MKTIAEFDDKKGFNVKLTGDKIYISAVGNEETFALRSVNGIGLYDNIEKYNKEIEAYKKKFNKNVGIMYYVFAAIFVVLGLYILVTSGSAGVSILLVALGFAVGGWYIMKKVNDAPKAVKLDSYFRIMLSGGSREFKFDKNDNNATDVADFINKVEDTLTAYNK